MPAKKTAAKKPETKAAAKAKPTKKGAEKSKLTVATKKAPTNAKKTVPPKTMKSQKPAAKEAVVKKPEIKTPAAKTQVTSAKKGKVSPLPKGYNNITPYLIVNNANKALDFYQKVFGAKVVMKMDKPGGKIGHAELRFGDTKIMIADEFPDMGITAPKAGNANPVSIHLYTKNVDKTLQAATSAGAKVVRPIEETFYGDRICALDDPFGHRWHVATHVTDVSMATIKKRAAEAFGKKK